MAMKSIALGVALIVLGVAVSVLSSSGSITSYIPAFIGLLFIGLGIAGSVKPDLNHHMMHGAAALALLSILSSLGSLIARASEASGWAIFSQVATIALCAGFVFLAVQSFRQARLAREAAAA